MKKYIILSVNDNPQYMFYTPLVVMAWIKLGWLPVIFYHGNMDKFLQNAYVDGYDDLTLPITDVIHDAVYSLNDIEGIRSETIVQVSRLYGACVLPADSYIMTGDIDMIPLSDYWHPKKNEITIYGHDLTGFGHYPICYIGMPHDKWVQTMAITSADYNALIKRDLDELPQAKSHDSVKRWVTDQDLITERIKAVNFEKTFINRGTYPNGYAKGRVDRSAWTLNHDQFIDCHMLRDIYRDPRHMQMTMDMLQKVWPAEDFTWFEKYTEEFRKLV